MKNFKCINLKKMMPSFVSIIVIAGMAIQSFATSVDMAAFVNKDKYMTKYYELDWRLDLIETTLDNLYKFTCTNLVSFGGTYSDSSVGSTNFQSPFETYYSRNAGDTYQWFIRPVADLSAEGYLRFNHRRGAINAFNNHTKNDTFETVIPASQFKWRSDIELYPHTKVIMKVTRQWPGTSTTDGPNETWEQELIMGPFKKFPYITATGESSAGDICSTRLRSVRFPTAPGSMSYSYNSDTIPTSWTSMTGVVSTVHRSVVGAARADIRYTYPTEEELQNNYFSASSEKNSPYAIVFYISTAMGTDISSRDKVWIRCTNNTASTYGADANFGGLEYFKLTSWNNNK